MWYHVDCRNKHGNVGTCIYLDMYSVHRPSHKRHTEGTSFRHLTLPLGSVLVSGFNMWSILGLQRWKSGAPVPSQIKAIPAKHSHILGLAVDILNIYRSIPDQGSTRER